jgi:hypothetical protein
MEKWDRKDKDKIFSHKTFDDNWYGDLSYILHKWKRRRREQDSRETDRESVWERGSARWKRRGSVSHKMSRYRNTFG